MRKYLPQILLSLAGLLLLLLFLMPMWKITLIAPQYPKGIQLNIHINKIGGSEPGTLQNVNILNHYIGMKPIEPDSIAELKYFPMALIGFTILAILFSLINRKSLYILWFGIFTVCLCLAVYDFYLWEYDYGHNLSPNAPMKFEGESFQPPLFGSKNVINFVAKSYPHFGGYVLMLSVLLSALATYLKIKKYDA